ncbi:POT family-domain-containing protein [Gigaspora rosea]|uniref:POT family-domain-containing protein n=1 Tax=Gigaspora rosea TaxID=44941 RepID=A0A397VPG0_9GLOM|nr:POT family-domain-containing protein [Gigaspora rosea]
MSDLIPQEENVPVIDEPTNFTDNNTKLDVKDVATTEESNKLRKVSGRVPIAAWFIIICELCERFTYYGVSGPFQNYIQFPPPAEQDGQPGAIGAGQQVATALNLFFQFFCFITSIFGAILADQYIGRYNTILMFCCVYMVGLVILTLTAIPAAIAAKASFPGLIIAMVIIGLGTGGIKCNVSPMAAEQNTNTKPYVKTLKSGEKVVVDPELTTQSIFHWFYLAINIGGLSPIITTNIEKYHSFWLAYLIPLLMFCFAILVLLTGKNKLIKKPPSGSALLNCFRVIRVAISHDRSLENAKPSNMTADDKVKKRVTWDDDFVDQVRLGLQTIRVFLFFPIYWVCYSQMFNNLISQAATMQVDGVPNDVMNNLDTIVLVIFTPLANYVLYPLLLRCGISLRPITKIFIGFMLACLAMIYAAVLQYFVYHTSPCYSQTLCLINDVPTPNNINVWWQSPAYILIGLSEVFAVITGLNYAYSKAPEALRSSVTAIFLLTNAFGSLLGFMFIPLTKDPDLVYLYITLSILVFITGLLLLYFLGGHDDMGEAENQKVDKI